MKTSITINLFFLTIIYAFIMGCDSSTDPPTVNNTVNGTLTLPATADGKEWFVLIDTDLSGDKYISLIEGTCGSGITENYSISNISAGTYYIYAFVRIVSAHGNPPENGDYGGIYGGTFNNLPNEPNAVIPSEGTVVLNITLNEY
jgi:hypothetical protein